MKKRIWAIVLIISLIAACMPILSWPVLAAGEFNFCDIMLTTEAGEGDLDDGDVITFAPYEDTWVAADGEYCGVTDYIMSTNCDKDAETTQYDYTNYAVSFTMPFTGTVNFKASVSGEEDYDYLTVIADGTIIYTTEQIYNEEWEETPWIDVSFMARIDQKIYISYSKDSSEWDNEDRAYIADLSLTDLGIVFSDEIADTQWYDEAETEFTLSTREELCGFSALVNQGVTFEDCTIDLNNDIDMSGVVWVPAGQYNIDRYDSYQFDTMIIKSGPDTLSGLNAYFAGDFNGQGYTISNLYCKYAYPSTTYIGFVAMNFGMIENLVLKNPIIGDGDIAKSAGAVAGFNGGVIAGCAVNGGEINITWNRYFMAYAGGLVGTNGYVFTLSYMEELNTEGGLIIASYSSADVQATYTRSGFFGNPPYDVEAYLAAAGGLAGAAYGGIISDCYATGDVSATAIKPIDDYDVTIATTYNDTYAISGGLIGMVLSELPEMSPASVQPNSAEPPAVAEIDNCYATGAVTATGPSAATSITAGFLGFARNMTPGAETETYLVTILNCYFDNEATGRTNGFKKAANFEGVTGKTSAEMKEAENYADWDFDEIWFRYDNINNGYPVLTDVGIGKVFTVTFVDHDDTVLKTESVSNGEAATAPTDVEWDGYTFISWDTAFDVITEDTTVKAQYNINQVTKGDISVEGVDGTSLDINTVLVAERMTNTLTDAAKKSYNFKITGLADGKELVDLFDIKLLVNNQAVQPDGSVRVRIKLTEAQLAYTDLEIVYIDDEGNPALITSTIEDGYIVFVTDHFSNYGIIGTAPAEPEETADTGMALPLLLILIALSTGTVMAIKKRQTEVF